MAHYYVAVDAVGLVVATHVAVGTKPADVVDSYCAAAATTMTSDGDWTIRTGQSSRTESALSVARTCCCPSR